MIPALDQEDLRELMSGEHDQWYEKANELLRTSKLEPRRPKGGFLISSHVETKFAVAMKEKGVKYAKVVINNTDGVCNEYMNCRNAVRVILPVGWKMDVYYPGGANPVPIIGARVEPWPSDGRGCSE
ncbi:DddA-like double-stranded DNA deaminase toxin [Streptomyces rubradiris]|uniref:DddA-like double-stranded DNA deaminase toxin n=1 Tax=Streptomyces rubradiris TaxID=285531 RepID=UPI0036EBB6C1